MATCLVDEIRAVDNIPYFVDGVDRDKEIKEQIEVYAEKNKLVKQAVSGEINLATIAHQIGEDYGKGKFFYPSDLPEEEKSRLKELEEIVRYYDYTYTSMRDLNPVTGGVGGVLVGALFSIIGYGLNKRFEKNDKKQTPGQEAVPAFEKTEKVDEGRRKFIKDGLRSMGSIGAVGGIVGFLSSYGLYISEKEIIKEMEYVQNTINRIYGLSQDSDGEVDNINL